jgi:hypothetical protein
VSEELNKTEQGVSSDIIFVTQGKSGNRDVLLVEVRLSSKEVAIRIRKTFAQKRKNKKDAGKIFITNCVTLATRVRTEIMKAMARKFQTEHEEIFVMGYSTWPTLHVKPKEKNQKALWLSFSDALVRYGAGLKETDLAQAYNKAGIAFRGQLEQNFVVLHERSETSYIPKKRFREEAEQEPSSKNPRQNEDN